MSAGIGLPEKVLAVHRALAEVDHAFGGALALAYCAEPRSTVDIDLNVFVPQHEPERVLGPLRALGAEASATDAELVRRDGQVRIRWERTPIDLFFSYDPFHDAACAAARDVPFADASIRVLAPEHLIVCKVVFDRSKDWVDIEAIVEARTPVEVAEVARWVGRIVGEEDPRFRRVISLLTT